ncbi:FUSC family protein [Cysteiniphilum litorale]|uniref:FUSC family protein n=1 Tax=Cysteiniphilum litorale TaxID=2056700 RepID=UPI003F881CD5
MTNLLYSKRYSLINALKAVVASAIAYLVGHLLGEWLNVGQMYAWIVITVLVVMSSQPNLGGALEKAKMRFLGTLIGSICSIIVILIFPEMSMVQLILGLGIIAIGVFTATNSSKYTYAGVLGSVTVAIILFSSDVSLATACYRTLEVLIGITIAIIVNRYFFPIHAYKRINQSFCDTVNCIASLNSRLFAGGDYDDVLVEIFGHFSKQIALQKEIMHEKPNIDLKVLKVTTRHLRQLYRYTSVIYDYIETYPEKREKFQQNPAFKALYDEINHTFKVMSISFKKNVFDQGEYQKITTKLEELLKTFSQSMSIQSELRHASVVMFSFKKFIDTVQMIEENHNLLSEKRY